MYIQYFPEPSEFTGGSANEVFFWERTSKLDLALVARLFEREDVTIHVHKAMDPHQHTMGIGSDEEGWLGVAPFRLVWYQG